MLKYLIEVIDLVSCKQAIREWFWADQLVNLIGKLMEHFQ